MANKTLLILTAAAVLCTTAACAEVYEGTTAAERTETITAECEGTIDEVCVEAGDHIEAGDTVVQLRHDRTYAAEDGTVARVLAFTGNKMEGTLVEVSPDSRYTIYCTVDDAYESTDTEFVHLGEEVYIKCTYDGTHRGTGKITSISNDEYTVETDGGELYVGETVYLYRDSAFTSTQRIGIGTVTGSKTVSYDVNGVPLKIYVSAGDYVEKGQLLFESVADGNGKFTADCAGIVSSVSAAEGDRVEEGQTLMEVVPEDAIVIEISVPETDIPYINVGDSVEIEYSCNIDESVESGTVASVSQIADDGYYSVKIRPDETPEYLGMTAEVRIGE